MYIAEVVVVVMRSIPNAILKTPCGFPSLYNAPTKKILAAFSAVPFEPG
jgi:hypothetical protein